MSATIRALEVSDLPAVLALWSECEGVGLSASDSLPELERFLLRNPKLSAVAMIGAQLVGAVLAGHDGRRGYLYHLAVTRRARRGGVGSALAKHALASLRAEGILKTHLFIYKDNESGRTFWLAQGWQARTDLDVCSFEIESRSR